MGLAPLTEPVSRIKLRKPFDQAGRFGPVWERQSDPAWAAALMCCAFEYCVKDRFVLQAEDQNLNPALNSLNTNNLLDIRSLGGWVGIEPTVYFI